MNNQYHFELSGVSGRQCIQSLECHLMQPPYLRRQRPPLIRTGCREKSTKRLYDQRDYRQACNSIFYSLAGSLTYRYLIYSTYLNILYLLIASRMTIEYDIKNMKNCRGLKKIHGTFPMNSLARPMKKHQHHQT